MPKKSTEITNLYNDILNMIYKALKKEDFQKILNSFFPNKTKNIKEAKKIASTQIDKEQGLKEKLLENRKKPIANEALVLFILLVIILVSLNKAH